MNKFLKVLLGTGLYLLDQSDHATKGTRGRVANRVDDLRDLAQEKYEAAADRVSRVSNAVRGSSDDETIAHALRFVAGLGIGVGVGLLFAPASGSDTRTMLSERAQDLGDHVRRRFSHTPHASAAD